MRLKLSKIEKRKDYEIKIVVDTIRDYDGDREGTTRFTKLSW